jgi:hypothetical protein
MKKALTASLVAISLCWTVGCGDDDDEDSDSAGTATTDTQATTDSQAAQDLESYLKDSPAKQSISYVEEVDGELKIWTRLNAAAVTDDNAGRQVCKLAAESGVPGAESAVVVDAGAEEFPPC